MIKWIPREHDDVLVILLIPPVHGPSSWRVVLRAYRVASVLSRCTVSLTSRQQGVARFSRYMTLLAFLWESAEEHFFHILFSSSNILNLSSSQQVVNHKSQGEA